MTDKRVHGTEGAYLGGEWASIEECAASFNKRYEGSATCDKSCKRSSTKKSAAKADGTYDVVIIGAGCIGGTIARELSKTTASVLVLDAADDVSQGATKGNSGIVHAGYDDTPGSVRAKFCWKGNQMFPQLDRELHFGYQRNGSLVVARGPEDEAHLQELKKRGEVNGVQNLRIIGKEELFAMEPHIHPASTAALYAPDAGNLIPYEFTIALFENAVQNGVEVRIRREVTSIEQENGNGNGEQLFKIKAKHWEPKAYLQHTPSAGKSDTEVADVVVARKKAIAQHRAKVAKNSLTASILIGAITSSVAAKQNIEFLRTSNPIIGKVITFLLVSSVVYTFVYMLLIQSGLKDKSSEQTSESAKGKSLAELVPKAHSSIGGGGEKCSVEQSSVGGSGSATAVGGQFVEEEIIRARYIVNAAGSGSDKVANMIGDKSFKIKPRIGDYVLLNKNQGHLATRTLFPCPGPLGKGVLVQTTLWGNLILGPTARDQHDPEMMNQTAEEIQTFIFSKCKELVPGFDPKETIHAFSGVRAKSSRNDWIIEPSAINPRFIHAAGIDSPGLAGSPAIALEIVRLLREGGLNPSPNPAFNPNRFPLICPKSGWKGIRAGPVGKFNDPKENIICKCEKVTEAEVIAACRGPLPIDSTQAIRKRTRAGMGHCQGNEENYDCERRVAAIIARELDMNIEAVGRRPWPATSTLPQRWINEEEKFKLDTLKDVA